MANQGAKPSAFTSEKNRSRDEASMTAAMSEKRAAASLVCFSTLGDDASRVAAATLLASSPSVEKHTSDAAARFSDIAAVMDASSRERFFSLVKAEGFAPWFATVTPLEEIGLLALGSRPARRGLSVESLEDLRAIPWVFAWTQARINLAGWFGLGTALAAVGDEGRLIEAYRDWPLLRTMIDNVAMSLSLIHI